MESIGDGLIQEAIPSIYDQPQFEGGELSSQSITTDANDRDETESPGSVHFSDDEVTGGITRDSSDSEVSGIRSLTKTINVVMICTTCGYIIQNGQGHHPRCPCRWLQHVLLEGLE